MKTIFVTGGAGYIGSICVEQLLNEGFEVAVFDNLSEGHRKALDPRARFFQGDLADRTVIGHALGETRPDAVMHFAANALVGESMQNPSKYFRNNVCAGINLLDAAVEAGVGKFVFSSTCATFGIPDRMPLDESLPQKPINPYGESKLMFEQVLRWYEEIHGLSYVALRYFNAAGASELYGEDHRVETHLIPNVLKVALGQKESVSIFGTDYPTPDGTCLRDYVHVDDLSRAHIAVFPRLASPGAALFYNLGTGRPTSNREVIRAVELVTGRKITVLERARRAGDPPALYADSTKAQRELGWKVKFPTIDSIVATAWKWHSSHPDGYPE